VIRSIAKLIGSVPDCLIAMCPVYIAVALFQLKIWAQIYGG